MIHISNCRCDDRLIHGQIIYKWIQYLKVKKLIVIDDEVADDVIEQGLIKMSAPKQCELHILSIEEAKRYFYDKSSEDTFVLVKHLDTISNMLKDFQIDVLNLGRLPTAVGKKRIGNHIYVNGKDYNVIKMLLASKTSVNIQMVPDEKQYSVNEHLSEIEKEVFAE